VHLRRQSTNLLIAIDLQTVPEDRNPRKGPGFVAVELASPSTPRNQLDRRQLHHMSWSLARKLYNFCIVIQSTQFAIFGINHFLAFSTLDITSVGAVHIFEANHPYPTNHGHQCTKLLYHFRPNQTERGQNRRYATMIKNDLPKFRIRKWYVFC
jgi:hypothetical protein